MTRYALLLRGVNVGKKNSLPMAELRAMLAKLGCTDVQTYVQSGNAVFGTKLGEVALTKAIEHQLEEYMGTSGVRLELQAACSATMTANSPWALQCTCTGATPFRSPRNPSGALPRTPRGAVPLDPATAPSVLASLGGAVAVRPAFA
jgi:hypothetical protein